MAEFRRADLTSSYGKPTIFVIREDLYAWMINHEYGASALDAQSITDATLRARDELHRLVGGLRGLGGVWSNIHIVATAEQIGVREGRRIHGRYTLTTDELVSGARFNDAVCRASFPIDVHSTNRHTSTAVEPSTLRSQPYDIPLRSLIARDVDGLLMAGRCISGDFIAHSSYRVTGNAVPMGEAAGVCAAVAARDHCLPHEVEFSKVSELLGR
jgi:hypothetical protein